MRLWLSHDREVTQTEGETHTADSRGPAHPQTCSTGATPSALLLDLWVSPCKAPSTHIPLQWGLERPFTMETGTQAHPRAPQHTS